MNFVVKIIKNMISMLKTQDKTEIKSSSVVDRGKFAGHGFAGRNIFLSSKSDTNKNSE